MHRIPIAQEIAKVQPQPPDAGRATVLVAIHDAQLRTALQTMLRDAGKNVRCYASARELLDAPPPDGERCLVADMHLPEICGLELAEQFALKAGSKAIPTVFVTGWGDVAQTVRAMKGGAVDVLAVPFTARDMAAAVDAALARDRMRIEIQRRQRPMLERYDTLTPRERQVMEGVVRGLLNKQIAWELEISEITVKLHRSSLMRKLQLRSVPDLVRAAQTIDTREPA